MLIISLYEVQFEAESLISLIGLITVYILDYSAWGHITH